MIKSLFEEHESDLLTKFHEVVKAKVYLKKQMDESVDSSFLQDFSFIKNIEENLIGTDININLDFFEGINPKKTKNTLNQMFTKTLTKPFESGVQILSSLQQMILLGKANDDFYEYKIKILDVE